MPVTWSKLHADALAAAFDALESARLDWMVLRNYRGLPQSCNSKDIDIGVSPADFRRAEKVITEAVRQHGFDRRQTTVYQRFRCSTYFGIVEGRPVSIKIDLIDGFSWRGADWFPVKRLNRARQTYNGFQVPGPTDNAVMLWLKPLTTGAGVKPAYVDSILEAVRDDPDGFRAEIERLFSPDLARQAWQALEAGELDRLIPLRKKLAWNAWWRTVRAEPLQSVWGIGVYVWLELLRRSCRPEGTFLAVLGPDGVGKTTFLEELRHQLAALQVKDPENVEIRHFRPHVFPNLNALLTGKPDVHDGRPSVPHQAPPANPASSLLRLIYYWADYVWGYWGGAHKRSVAGRTIIYDRYFYDFLVDPRRSRLSLPPWITRMFIRLTPQPDLVFILAADPETIYSRKQELPRQEIARQLEEYRSLHDSNPSRFVMFDATLPVHEIVGEAMTAIVKRLYKK